MSIFAQDDILGVSQQSASLAQARLVPCNRSSFIKPQTSRGSFESREAAEYLSPGREPWVRRPSPRLRHPSPAGPPPEGSGPQGGRERGRGRGRVPQPTALRRGLRYGAPSELTFAGNFGYRTLAEKRELNAALSL